MLSKKLEDEKTGDELGELEMVSCEAKEEVSKGECANMGVLSQKLALM